MTKQRAGQGRGRRGRPVEQVRPPRRVWAPATLAALSAVVGGQLLGATPATAASHPGAVYAWGDDDAGQIGNGTISTAANHDDEDPHVPVAADLPSGTAAVSVAGGQSFSLAATTTGAVYTWGFNKDGDLGTGGVAATTVPVRSEVPSGDVVTEVAAGYKQSMALTSAGQVLTWGQDDDGQDGIGAHGGTTVTPTPVTSVPAGTDFTAIAAGFDHDLAVTANGAVYDWGLNSSGQLGDGGTTNSNVPVPVPLPAGVAAAAVAGAAGHSLALTRGGAVYAWGANQYGQLGDGSTVGSDVPVRVALPHGVKATAVAAGDGSGEGLTGGYSLALTASGAIYAWGDNASGDLGDGTTVDSDVPVAVQVPPGLTPVAVTAGGNRCHLLTSAGAVYDWGTGETGGRPISPRPPTSCRPASRRWPSGTARPPSSTWS